MANWYDPLNKALDVAFDSKPYQYVTSLGPIQMPRGINSTLRVGQELLSNNVPEVKKMISNNASSLRLNERNWTRGMNGVVQGTLATAVFYFSRGVFSNKGLNLALIGGGIFWTATAIRHILLYGRDQRNAYFTTIRWPWQL